MRISLSPSSTHSHAGSRVSDDPEAAALYSRSYDFDRFDPEDVFLYRDVLEALPFDPGLNAFFLEEGFNAARLKRFRRKYAAPWFHAEGTVPSAEQEYFRLEDQRLLERMFYYLPPITRNRVQLHCQDMRSFREIAKMEGVSVASVRKSVKAGLKKLKTLILENRDLFYTDPGC